MVQVRKKKKRKKKKKDRRKIKKPFGGGGGGCRAQILAGSKGGQSLEAKTDRGCSKSGVTVIGLARNVRLWKGGVRPRV